ncbi:MAG: antibiotic biosynthesis monooxygenase [Parafilimonas sp.]
MIKYALLATLKAKPGKEKEVEAFLKSGGEMAIDEPKTITWYAFKLSTDTFCIFDTFEDESGREAHLTGEIAKALMAKAPDLFSVDPDIKKADVLAVKNQGD